MIVHATALLLSYLQDSRKWPMSRKRKLAWTNKLPKGEGWYWFRNEERSVVSSILSLFNEANLRGAGLW
jgi:hypothetical protein